MSEYIFLMDCPDQPGILAAAAAAVAAAGGDIRDAASFGDADEDRFFVRIHLTLEAGRGVDALHQTLPGVAARFGAQWSLHEADRPQRVMIMVSKFTHCLSDLLNRLQLNAMPGEVPLIVSNHETARSIAEWYNVDYHCLPVTADTKPAQEAEVLRLIEEHRIDLVVLARYMQVLSPAMSKALAGRCINIHHSFLPSFKGARPYHQAHKRGVKLIGATAHYVTDDLDEGPIIEQDVRRVTHATSSNEMLAMGREIEASVLARAVRWHLEQRIIINGQKTVVFS